MTQYEGLVTALKGSGIAFAEYGWATRPASDFGVVALDIGAGKTDTDNGTRCEVHEGTVDLYMHGRTDAEIATVKALLEAHCGASWELNSVQHEEDTGLLHYEWVFRVAG